MSPAARETTRTEQNDERATDDRRATMNLSVQQRASRAKTDPAHDSRRIRLGHMQQRNVPLHTSMSIRPLLPAGYRNNRGRPYSSPSEDGCFLDFFAHVTLPGNGGDVGRLLPLLAAARWYRPVLRADHRPRRGRQLPQAVQQIPKHVAAQRVVVVPSRLARTD